MADIISPLLQWLNTHPELSGLVTFTISAGESIAIIGTIVPGTIMMTAVGMLAGAGVIPLWPTILWAILGAIVGDGISYWFGYFFKSSLPSIWPFKTHPTILKKGELFFDKYGSMSVFIGRFVGPVRALVPLVAGMLNLRPWQFTIANILSAILWAPTYMLPGIVLGAAALELPPDIAVHVMLVLLLGILFILLCLWFLYKLYMLVQARINQTLDNLWVWLKKSRYFSFLTKILKGTNPTQTHGQLNLAFYFLLTVLLFSCLALYIKHVGGASHLAINNIGFHFFRGIRDDHSDSAMLCLTLLGQKEVILPLIATLFLWLLVTNRFRAAWHIALLGVLAAGGIFVTKIWIHSLRPWGIYHSPETFSMPSGHTVLSTTIFLGITFLLTRSIAPKWRYLAYTFCLLLLFSIGMSRLYLGAHWFTDILSGWLLGAGILTFVLISYEREPERPIPPLGLILVSLGTLMITYSLFCYTHFHLLQKDYAIVSWPQKQFNAEVWWQKNNVLDVTRTSLFGFPTQPINIEWVGDINAIKSALINNGWEKAPARDLISTLHRLADVHSAQYLPMVSPQYHDKRPDFVLTQTLSGDRGLIVLRLWKSRLVAEKTTTPLWVGTIGVVPTTYSWLYRPHKKMQHNNFDTVAIAYLFAKKFDSTQWQEKTLAVRYLDKKKRVIERKIVLLRQSTTQ